MSKKLTFEFVKNEFEKRNYILLEIEYINCMTKMKYKCLKCDNINSIKYNDLKSGYGCSYCANVKKHSIDFIKQEFKNRDYVLLENNYINAHTKMKYKCLKCNSINEINYNNLKSGYGCSMCGGTKKHSYKYIKEEFEKRNYEVLEDKYINARTKMKYKCLKCNNINKITYNCLKQGQGCPICSLEKKKGKNNPNWNLDRKYIKDIKKIRILCKSLLRRTLKLLNIEKNNRTCKLLGYYPKDLQRHLESFPNWNEIKEQNWHLDHIIPIKAFVENNITDLKIINNLSNLRPILAEENLKKSYKYLQEDFDNYINKKNIQKLLNERN